MDFTNTQRATLYSLVAIIALVSGYVRVKGSMARRFEASYSGSASSPAYPRSASPGYGRNARFAGNGAQSSADYSAGFRSGQRLGGASATVNINTGSLQELERLPGVGPVLAGRILALRQRLGRFTNVDQLMEVQGIGPKTLDKMRPYVAL